MVLLKVLNLTLNIKKLNGTHKICQQRQTIRINFVVKTLFSFLTSPIAFGLLHYFIIVKRIVNIII